MAGYSGYSMSNNAVDAYESGEKPRSKWTKAAILNAIEAEVLNGTLSLQCSIEKLKQAPLTFLRTKVLQYASWHHTSKYFNGTDFYSLDIDYLASLTDKRINEDVKKCGKEQSQVKNNRTVSERWLCSFFVWGGTRNHPSSKRYVEEGIIIGDFSIEQMAVERRSLQMAFNASNVWMRRRTSQFRTTKYKKRPPYGGLFYVDGLLLEMGTSSTPATFFMLLHLCSLSPMSFAIVFHVGVP